VTFPCDNTAAVSVGSVGYSRVAEITHLLPSTFFIYSGTLANRCVGSSHPRLGQRMGLQMTFLAHGDVWVDDQADPRFVVVSIKSSKTDPFRRRGISVCLGRTRTKVRLADKPRQSQHRCYI